MSCRNWWESSKVNTWPDTCKNWWFSWCLQTRSTLIPRLSWTMSWTTWAIDTKWVSSKMWQNICSTLWSVSKKALVKFLQIWTSMYVYLNISRKANRKKITRMSQSWILPFLPWLMTVSKWRKKKELLDYRNLWMLQMILTTQKSMIASSNM